jgi:hypothetical protein
MTTRIRQRRLRDVLWSTRAEVRIWERNISYGLMVCWKVVFYALS